MLYHNVCLEALSYTLPEEIITSDELERRLEPVYSRLRLPEGRLELMTGIRERRFWEPGTLPGQKSRDTAERLFDLAEIARDQVGALVHGSVCRDYLEPATAAGVHHGLGLSPDCLIYDVSNACLGLANGILQVANMIELGQIRAGIVVGTESSRDLVENTIHLLNTDKSLSREQIKLAVASLTLGSASAAVLLVDRELSRTGNRLLAATSRAHTSAHALCQGGYGTAQVSSGTARASDDRDQSNAAPVAEVSGSGDTFHRLHGAHSPALLMRTDSERLLQEGVAAAELTFEAFLNETGWHRSDIDKSCCHQVGAAHRKLMLQTLELDPGIDFATYETLGNTGAVALPTALAIGAQVGHVQPRDRTALLGIGSGVNVLMLAVEWQRSLIDGELRGTGFSPARSRLTPLVVD